MSVSARSSTDRVPVFGTVDVGSIPAGRTHKQKQHGYAVFVYVCGPERAPSQQTWSRGLGRRNFVSDGEQNIQDTRARRRHVFSAEKTVESWAEGNLISTEIKLSEVYK